MKHLCSLQDLVVCMWLHVPWLLLMDDEYRAKFPNATRLLKSVFDHPTTRKLSPVRSGADGRGYSPPSW